MPPTPRIISDPNNILEDMRENGSYVTGNHIVYKAGTHGEEYLDKDAHLQDPKAAEKVIQLLAQNIPAGSVIIAPETRSSVILGERIAQISQSRFVSTKKVSDIHTFPSEIVPILVQGKHPRILVDDILNNGETFAQVSKAMAELGLILDEFHVMVDRNPEKSGQLGIPVISLAQLQIPQWDEKEISKELQKKPITTKLGKARNWTPKNPGEFIAVKFFLERLAKQRQGFTFDDGLEIVQMNEDEFFFQPKQ